MMSSQLAAGLTAFAGLCLVAGWVSALRNRAYVGWLGLAFLALAGSLWCAGVAREAQEMGASAPRMALLAKILLLVSAASFVIAVVAAVQETRRRLRQIKEAHEASVEALLAMVRSGRERAEGEGDEGPQVGESDEDDAYRRRAGARRWAKSHTMTEG